MSQYLSVHPTHPQRRLIRRAAEIIDEGGVAVYPTDSTYALGCHIGDAKALQRIRRIRRLDDKHLMTLLCRDLSELATYARVEDSSYRIIRRLTPGPFTFVLPATREVPRRLIHSQRRTIGLRVPDNAVALALLEVHGEPLLSTTMRLPDDELPLSDMELARSQLEQLVDVIVEAGPCGNEATTVIDLTTGDIEVVREGAGQI